MTEVTKVDGSIQPKVAVRMIFSNVNEAKQVRDKRTKKPTGDPKFGGTFALDGETAKDLIARAIEVAKAAWPGRAIKELKFPFTKAEVEQAAAKAANKDPSIYPDGYYILRAKSKYAPELFIRNGRKVEMTQVATPLAKAKFYSGCWVLPHVNFVAYNGVGSNPDGVTAYLQAVLWDHDGERVGGSVGAGAFAEYAGHATDEDPTGGAGSALDDEVPF